MDVFCVVLQPVAIGKAVFPLRCLLQREQLSQTIILPVQSLQGTGESQDIGPLKVSLPATVRHFF